MMQSRVADMEFWMSVRVTWENINVRHIFELPTIRIYSQRHKLAPFFFSEYHWHAISIIYQKIAIFQFKKAILGSVFSFMINLLCNFLWTQDGLGSKTSFGEMFIKFSLAPMEVLAHHLRMLYGSACPSNNIRGHFLLHFYAKSPSNILPNPSEVMSKVSEPKDSFWKYPNFIFEWNPNIFVS